MSGVLNFANKKQHQMKFKIAMMSGALALLVLSCGGGSEAPSKSGKEQAKEMSDALMDEMEAAAAEAEKTSEEIEEEKQDTSATAE